ncbi:hypothetical protein PG997_006740 [Apiospora hydei]|uniref:Uncharacterized protein n=1 Tax=Apiospora hydei TaxID=1337664 RepID=A0ABR1WPL2_9PEZI
MDVIFLNERQATKAATTTTLALVPPVLSSSSPTMIEIPSPRVLGPNSVEDREILCRGVALPLGSHEVVVKTASGGCGALKREGTADGFNRCDVGML